MISIDKAYRLLNVSVKMKSINNFDEFFEYYEINENGEIVDSSLWHKDMSILDSGIV